MASERAYPKAFVLRVTYAIAALLPGAAIAGIISAGADPLHPPNTLTLLVLALPIFCAVSSLVQQGATSVWGLPLGISAGWWFAAALFLAGRVDRTEDVLGPVLALSLPAATLWARLRGH